LEKILEYEVQCPICGSKFTVSDYLYEAPYVGKLIISGGVCSRCGYKWSDVRLAESRGARRIVYRVEKPDDVNALVVRASTATVRIPELGVEIIPGYAAQGYITTVEGLVLDILEKTKFLCESGEAPREECLEKISLLEKAANGEISYTIELLDPIGVSMIASNKVIEKPLEAAEAPKEEK